MIHLPPPLYTYNFRRAWSLSFTFFHLHCIPQWLNICSGCVKWIYAWMSECMGFVSTTGLWKFLKDALLGRAIFKEMSIPLSFGLPYVLAWASQVALVVKNMPANAGDIRVVGSIPGLGRSPGGGQRNPLQYSCLENPMDGGAWWATGHRVTKNRTRLKWLSKHMLAPTMPHPSVRADRTGIHMQ